MENGPYPGDLNISAQAEENCDRRYSLYYPPSTETWPAGDRTVFFTQESYGLASTNVERFDRLVGANAVVEGECDNEAPETNFVHVELVDCASQWEFRVLNTFEVELPIQFAPFSRPWPVIEGSLQASFHEALPHPYDRRGAYHHGFGQAMPAPWGFLPSTLS